MATVGFDDSILSSIKTLMPNSAIPQDYAVFDTEIIGLINSELAVISQLGVGNTNEVFSISGTSEVWSDFIDNTELLNLVAMYIAIRVKITFDPPQSTVVMDALNKRSDELSFRIQDAAKRYNKEA